MEPQTNEADALAGVVLLNGRAGRPNNPVAMTGSTMSTSGNDVIISFTPDHKAIISFQNEVGTII